MTAKPRFITDIDCMETGIQLEVMECVCGFHLGVDFSYLQEVGRVDIDCPSCQTTISFDEVE